jgi:hypothetical protein
LPTLLFTTLMDAAVLLIAVLRDLTAGKRLVIASSAVFLAANLPILTYFVTKGVPFASIAVLRLATCCPFGLRGKGYRFWTANLRTQNGRSNVGFTAALDALL